MLKKGAPVGPVEAAALEAAGIKDIIVARLEPGDVMEDVGATEIAASIAGEGVHVDRAFTGRANLFAESAGVLVVDKDAVDRINRVDEAITMATLSAYKPVIPGEMIATLKIIPFGVAKSATDRRSTEPGRRECRYRCRHGTSVGKYGGSAYLLIGRVYDIPPGMMQIGRTGVVPFIRWQTWQRPSGEVRCDDHKKIRPFQE